MSKTPGVRAPIFFIFGCLLIAGALAFFTGCGGQAVQVETGDGSGPSSAAGTTPELSAAQASPGSPFGFHPARITHREYADSGLTDALYMGIGWAREPVYAFWFKVQPDMAVDEYDFSFYDVQWGQIPPQISIMGNLAPQGPTDMGRCLPGTQIPVDEEAYQAFVRATVERYDGDGSADMPGLANPILYWQVGNEPNNKRPSGFATLQRITYEAIKQACGQCQVIVGGVPGQPQDYIRMFDENYAPILAELQGKYVDIMDFHWYGAASGDYRLKDTVTGQDALDHIRQTLAQYGFPAGIPIWITEMGSYSGDPLPGRRPGVAGGDGAAAGPEGIAIPEPIDFPAQSERQQAGDYFKRFIYPASRGVEKVFGAFGIIEGFKHNDGYFDHTGLIYDGEGPGDPGLGVRKLGYYSYKKMSESLAGADFSTIETLHDGTGGDHLYLFRVMKQDQPVYIAWWDYFDDPAYTPGATKTLTIGDLAGGGLQITSVVPAAPDGASVLDYSTAFTSSLVPVQGGEAAITLGEDPVLALPQAG